MNTGSDEKRKAVRFLMSDGVFAFISNTPFLIQNISETGVKLESVVFEGAPADEMLMDIVMRNEDFFLQNIPVRLVRVQKIDTAPFSHIPSQCFGLQFGELTQQQKTRLDYFMTRCATSEA